MTSSNSSSSSKSSSSNSSSKFVENPPILESPLKYKSDLKCRKVKTRITITANLSASDNNRCKSSGIDKQYMSPSPSVTNSPTSNKNRSQPLSADASPSHSCTQQSSPSSTEYRKLSCGSIDDMTSSWYRPFPVATLISFNRSTVSKCPPLQAVTIGAELPANTRTLPMSSSYPIFHATSPKTLDRSNSDKTTCDISRMQSNISGNSDTDRSNHCEQPSESLQLDGYAEQNLQSILKNNDDVRSSRSTSPETKKTTPPPSSLTGAAPLAIPLQIQHAKCRAETSVPVQIEAMTASTAAAVISAVLRQAPVSTADDVTKLACAQEHGDTETLMVPICWCPCISCAGCPFRCTLSNHNRRGKSSASGDVTRKAAGSASTDTSKLEIEGDSSPFNVCRLNSKSIWSKIKNATLHVCSLQAENNPSKYRYDSAVIPEVPLPKATQRLLEFTELPFLILWIYFTYWAVIVAMTGGTAPLTVWLSAAVAGLLVGIGLNANAYKSVLVPRRRGLVRHHRHARALLEMRKYGESIDTVEMVVDWGMVIRFFLIPFAVSCLSGLTNSNREEFLLVFPTDPFFLILSITSPAVIVVSLLLLRVTILWQMKVRWSLQLLSSDSEDEDYVDSGNSDDDDGDEVETDDEEKRKRQADNKIRQEKALVTLESMTVKALSDLQHPIRVSPNNLLLPFHKPQPPDLKHNTSVDELYDYINRASGSKPIAQRTDVRSIKEQVRSQEIFHEAHSAAIDAAVSSLANRDAEVKVSRTVKYAGQKYEIKETVNRSSRKFQKSMKPKPRRMCGAFAGLESAVDHRLALLSFVVRGPDLSALKRYFYVRLPSELKNLQKVTSVEKSRADWQVFKDAQKLDDELSATSRKDGFLSRQAFLAAVDNRQYEISLDARKRQRTLQENAQHQCK